MDAENFFSRWSKRKAEPPVEMQDETAQPVGAEQPEQDLPPTIEEVAALTPQSDYTRFVARGVDENIRRSAFKKLFADPHFNIMDGLDTYIEDYNKFEPIPPAMLALLNHAKGLLDPLARFEHPLMRLMESEEAPVSEPSAAKENAADTVSASAEPQTLAPPEADDTHPSVPDDGTPSQTMIQPDDDDKIQSM